MARLCRIHVAGIGKEGARFNPLTVDLRNPENGTPQDSVIWLRNGGGKTTLISIFYSLLVPNASHFLGKMNGKNAALEDFLRPGQLACVVAEWELSTPGAPRRTVGQALLLKDHRLIRKYFSFSAVPEFNFNTLPVHGLAPAAKSLDRLEELLQEAQRSYPALDLVIEEVQWRWDEHLTNLGLDPALFRAHLVMNSQEGGATEIFKIKTPEEFVRRFLEMVWDEQSTEEIETTLKLFREKLAENPSYRAAIEFGEGLLKHLRPFAQNAARRCGLAREQAVNIGELSQLAFSVDKHLASLDQSIERLRAEAAESANTADLKDKERQRKDRFARGYDRRARRLRAHETECALRDSIQTRLREERQLSILSAARALKQVRVTQAALDASLQRLEELRHEHRPEMETVRKLGSVLFQSWDRRSADLQADLDLTAESIVAYERDLEELRVQRIDQTERRTRAEAQRDQAQTAIRRYDGARRKLRDEGALNEGESGAEARARWQAQIDRFNAQLVRLKGEVEALKRYALASDNALAEIAAKSRAKEQERTELETKLGIEAEKRRELEKLSIIVELAEGKIPDLRNPFLLETLDARGHEAHAEIVRLGVEAADDKRDDQAMEREGLLAPSTDVEQVLARLKRSGITSALPVYRWLDEHCTPDEAAELLRRHPTIYAAILVQNHSDFDRARQELDKAHIRTPVVILSPPDLSRSGGASSLHTVVPEERGLFSKSEAANALPRLQQRRREQTERHDRAERRRTDVESAATRLRDYLRAFPAERFASLRDGLEGVMLLLASLEAETSRVRHEREHTLRRLEEIREEQLRAQRDHGEAARREGQISTFLAEHEERIDECRKSAEYQQHLFTEADTELRHIARSEPVLKSAVAAGQHHAAEIKLAWQMAITARDNVPEEYRGAAPRTPDARSPEELTPVFASARTAYEGKIQKGEIEGAITVRRENLISAKSEYDRLRHDLPIDQIEAASQEHAIDVAIERQTELFDRAKAQETLAKSEHGKAQMEAPDEREFKEGEELDRERVDQPETSQACFQVALQYRELAALLRTETESARKDGQIIANRLADQEKNRPRYASWVKQLPGLAGDSLHPAFTGVPDEDDQILDRLLARSKSTTDQLARVEQALTQGFEKHIHPQIFQAGYDRFRIPFRDRLKLLQRDDFVSRADEHLQAVETHVHTCQSELDSEEQERRTIVDKLDGIARRATALLGQAETVSAMPDSIAAWAQQPFLRANVPKKNDLAERQVLLRQAIDRWFETGEIPSRHKLAYECLLAVCGTKSISIRILKPEYHLSPVPRDIMELVKFSDGEKLTAAILLYCVLVRLRARQKVRAQHVLTKDSGMLLLDNPFGKATLAEFVDLQLRMARFMGVQLIYATGINDFAALKHFPHYVRLRNSSRGKTSNDYHVTPDSRPLEGDQHVEGIVLGRHEKATNA